MFDAATYHSELRGGTLPWRKQSGPFRPPLLGNIRCEVLIVGAGITGALAAEHLVRQGLDVCIIDREQPGRGSTAASTAMLLWEIDLPLMRLADLYGFERAAQIYRLSFQAAAGLTSLVQELQIPCDFAARDSLYICGAEADAAAQENLATETKARQRAELPSNYLDYPALKRGFGFERAGAILSPNAADVDPVKLSHWLLDRAIAGGATIFDAEAAAYDAEGNGVYVSTFEGHVIEARHLVLATGYVMPDFLKPKLHQVASSWAVATAPLDEVQLWPGRCLIWEASDPYLYARTTADNRILVGGEDEEDGTDPEKRDGKIPAKAQRIMEKMRSLWPSMQAEAQSGWSGAFGVTQDGLPLIGRVPGRSNFYAAYGYGGNGITFSYIASRMIGNLIAGVPESEASKHFAIDRPNA